MGIALEDIVSIGIGVVPVTEDGITQGRTRLFGVTESGDLVELFDPWVDLPGDTQGAQISQDSAVRIGNDLYFTVDYSTPSGVGTATSSLQVMRLTESGAVETVVYIEGPGMSQYGWVSDPMDQAVSHNGNLYLQFFSSDPATGQVFEITPSGTVTQHTDFIRENYLGAISGMVFVGDTMFVRGDQQTPSGIFELWKITPNGTQSLVLGDSTNSVTDIAAFGDKAWFVVDGGQQFVADTTLWTVGESGAAQRVRIGSGNDVRFLDSDAGGLALVYETRGTNFGGNTIARLSPDGKLTTVLQDNSITGIGDVIKFGKELYFTGTFFQDGVIANGNALFHVKSDGTAEKLEGFYDGGLVGQDIRELHVSGGKLWFLARALEDDGFGGTMEVDAILHVLDKSGTVSVVSGPSGTVLDALMTDVFEFDYAVPEQILGTASADTVDGAIGRDLIMSLAGDDVVFCRNGNDTAFGLDGMDRLLGAAGNDFLFGGLGKDTVSGGLGNDSLEGGVGEDRLVGGGGNDTLQGDGGNDKMTGDAGADLFRFYFGSGTDIILDFQMGIDIVQLDSRLWGEEINKSGVRDILDVYGSFDGSVFVLDFGSAELRIFGVTTISSLVNDVTIY